MEQSTGAQMRAGPIPTLNDEPVDDVANSLFRKWGVGKKGQDMGILLLLVTRDRRSRLEVGYGLEPILPDGFAGGLLREMRPALRQNQYGEAMMVAAETIGDRIAKEKQVQIEPLRQRRVVRRHSGGLPWPMLILGGIAVLFFLLVRAVAAEALWWRWRRRRPPGLLGRSARPGSSGGLAAAVEVSAVGARGGGFGGFGGAIRAAAAPRATVGNYGGHSERVNRHGASSTASCR